MTRTEARTIRDAAERKYNSALKEMNAELNTWKDETDREISTIAGAARFFRVGKTDFFLRTGSNYVHLDTEYHDLPDQIEDDEISFENIRFLTAEIPAVLRRFYKNLQAKL